MTTMPLEQAVEPTSEGQSPAQQALAVAVALSAATQAGVEQRCRAWLAGRISATDLAYSSATVVLQGIAKALLAGEHFAEVEWATRVSPKVIAMTEHERLTRAMFGNVKDAERARAAGLRAALTKVSEVSAAAPEVSEVSEPVDTLVMRSTRLADAEVIRAGRTGYGQAVAQVIGEDPDYVWRFDVSANPCGRCVVLAAQTFPDFAQVPKSGAHVGCRCVAQAELR